MLARSRACVCTRVRVCACTCVSVRVRTRVCTLMHVCLRKSAFAHVRACVVELSCLLLLLLRMFRAGCLKVKVQGF